MRTENSTAVSNDDLMAGLCRLRAAGEISPDEFQLAKNYIQREKAKASALQDDAEEASKWKAWILVPAMVAAFLFVYWLLHNMLNAIVLAVVAVIVALLVGGVGALPFLIIAKLLEGHTVKRKTQVQLLGEVQQLRKEQALRAER